MSLVVLKGQPIPPNTLITDLERRFRCRECDAKGEAVLSVRWREQA
jgi:rubredoxin